MKIKNCRYCLNLWIKTTRLLYVTRIKQFLYNFNKKLKQKKVKFKKIEKKKMQAIKILPV